MLQDVELKLNDVVLVNLKKEKERWSARVELVRSESLTAMPPSSIIFSFDPTSMRQETERERKKLGLPSTSSSVERTRSDLLQLPNLLPPGVLLFGRDRRALRA